MAYPHYAKWVCLDFIHDNRKPGIGIRMDYYFILGVPKGADAETIKKAYRKLVKQCHPDTHPGDRKAEERFKQVSEAYAVLGDENKRREYDRKAAPGVKQEKKEASGMKFNRQPPKTGSAPKGGPIDVSALFEQYMGFK